MIWGEEEFARTNPIIGQSSPTYPLRAAMCSWEVVDYTKAQG